MEIQPLVDLGHFKRVLAIEGTSLSGEVSEDGAGFGDDSFGSLEGRDFASRVDFEVPF